MITIIPCAEFAQYLPIAHLAVDDVSPLDPELSDPDETVPDVYAWAVQQLDAERR